MNIHFFKTQKELRKWFNKNHKKEKELFVGYYKVSSGKPSVTWPQSVDEALCFGWIDGIRKSIDEESYCNRFTPRNPKSNWSAINIKKVEELTKLGLMKPEGLHAFSLREENKLKIYSYENPLVSFDKSFQKLFKANNKAWAFYQTTAPTYRKVTTRWVMSAKQEATKLKRLNELIADCALGKNIKAMNYGKKKMKIPFQVIDWNKIPKEEHKGQTGTSFWQTLQYDGLRVRIVEYSAGYLADHWCKKGHVVHCLEGEVLNEQENGEWHLLQTGMTYVVSDNLSSHRSVARGNVKLLIIDGDILR